MGNQYTKLQNIPHVCAACDTTTTYINKKGQECWHLHDGHFLCHSCHATYVWNPITEKCRVYKISYKRKDVVLNENPRKGKCEICNRRIGDIYIDYYGRIRTVTKTHMHHIKYDDNNVLANTIELCISCHSKETWKEIKNKEFCA